VQFQHWAARARGGNPAGRTWDAVRPAGFFLSFLGMKRGVLRETVKEALRFGAGGTKPGLASRVGPGKKVGGQLLGRRIFGRWTWSNGSEALFFFFFFFKSENCLKFLKFLKVNLCH